ncbi:uncharacterized protein VTP21DRAFT_2483 [Calcarisporiella thermophila]|uniref:uncharacterized protein n=1 Tax=Calcarisporiella thermophila TaxID=911321 RepID=UPI0037445839
MRMWRTTGSSAPYMLGLQRDDKLISHQGREVLTWAHGAALRNAFAPGQYGRLTLVVEAVYDRAETLLSMGGLWCVPDWASMAEFKMVKNMTAEHQPTPP